MVFTARNIFDFRDRRLIFKGAAGVKSSGWLRLYESGWGIQSQVGKDQWACKDLEILEMLAWLDFHEAVPL